MWRAYSPTSRVPPRTEVARRFSPNSSQKRSLARPQAHSGKPRRLLRCRTMRSFRVPPFTRVAPSLALLEHRYDDFNDLFVGITLLRDLVMDLPNLVLVECLAQSTFGFP